MHNITVSIITSLYRCEKFLPDYLLNISQLSGPESCEFILIHNDPTDREMELINNFKNGTIKIVHYAVPREGLYSSWNRAIKLARGKYITVWNVDDTRFPDSISMQAKALDENPRAAIAYGDIYGSTEYGKIGDKFYSFPEWEEKKEEFYRSYLMSCFQMWRKSIHKIIGYYDEQFRCVGDLDFQIRAAMHFPFVKVSRPLGVYLEDQPHKISGNGWQVLENNIVYLRYGVFEKIQFHLLPKSNSKYRKDRFLFFGKWRINGEKSPFSRLYHIKGILIGTVRMPEYILKTFLKKYVL